MDRVIQAEHVEILFRGQPITGFAPGASITYHGTRACAGGRCDPETFCIGCALERAVVEAWMEYDARRQATGLTTPFIERESGRKLSRALAELRFAEDFGSTVPTLEWLE